MTREDLNREFDNRKVLYYDGGLCLFQADDAIALVQRAAEATIPILGIDALDLRPGRTTSSIENIADFSDAVAAGDGCWLEAEAFTSKPPLVGRPSRKAARSCPSGAAAELSRGPRVQFELNI